MAMKMDDDMKIEKAQLRVTFREEKQQMQEKMKKKYEVLNKEFEKKTWAKAKEAAEEELAQKARVHRDRRPRVGPHAGGEAGVARQRLVLAVGGDEIGPVVAGEAGLALGRVELARRQAVAQAGREVAEHARAALLEAHHAGAVAADLGDEPRAAAR